MIYTHWNKWLENKDRRTTKEENELIEKYKFTNNNMSKYHKADTLSLEEFKLSYNIDITSRTLNTLRGGKSFSGDKYYSEDRYYLEEGEHVEKVVVSYVFNDKILFQSKCSDDIYFGPDYDFKTIFFGGIPYEWFNIDGVLFNKK